MPSSDDGHQAAFVARVREYLKDPAAPYLWTDNMLWQALDIAITQYSFEFPQILALALDGNTGQVAYDLSFGGVTDPADLTYIDVLAVQCPAGTNVPSDPNVPIVQATTQRHNKLAYRAQWPYIVFSRELQGDELGSFTIHALVTSTWPRWTTDSADTSLNTSIPGYNWNLLVLLAVRAAYRQAALQGLKTPQDLDPGHTINQLTTEIDTLIASRKKIARSHRLSGN